MVTIGKPIDGCMYPYEQPTLSKEQLDKICPPLPNISEDQMPENIELYLSSSFSKMTTFQEMEDEFIFEHLVKYVNDELYTPENQIRIPKQLLIRAITCFKEEHRGEYEALMKGEENKECLEKNL